MFTLHATLTPRTLLDPLPSRITPKLTQSLVLVRKNHRTPKKKNTRQEENQRKKHIFIVIFLGNQHRLDADAILHSPQAVPSRPSLQFVFLFSRWTMIRHLQRKKVSNNSQVAVLKVGSTLLTTLIATYLCAGDPGLHRPPGSQPQERPGASSRAVDTPALAPPPPYKKNQTIKKAPVKSTGDANSHLCWLALIDYPRRCPLDVSPLSVFSKYVFSCRGILRSSDVIFNTTFFQVLLSTLLHHCLWASNIPQVHCAQGRVHAAHHTGRHPGRVDFLRKRCN